MKFFTVFAAVLALSAAYDPIATWTLEEISQALHDPATDPAVVPYLVDGLNTIMAGLHAGDAQTAVVISVPVSESMTLDQLSAAIHDPNTNPALLPYYENALNELMVAMFAGEEVNSIVLNIPAMEVNVWNLEQLSAALQNPETDPELHIYLEHALNQIMTEIWSGSQVTEIAVITPPGVIAAVPVAPEVIIPEPVVVAPVVPEVIIPEPVVVAPVAPEVAPPTPAVVPEAVASASSALVQIIVNVNAQAPAAAATPEAAVVAPMPVLEAEHVIISPMPVVDAIQEIISPMPVVDAIQEIISPMPVVDGAVISPMPVVDGAQEIISPMPVVDTIQNVPIIAVGPWA